MLLTISTALLGANLFFVRRLLLRLDLFKAEVRQALYGDADTPGILTRLALMEREQRRQGGSADAAGGVLERLAAVERAQRGRGLAP